jgi:tRNA/rRNA methyltransferase
VTGAGTNHTQQSLTGGPAVILVRPQLAVNIGMCARAMVNFGLSDLRLVNPREGWPRKGALRKGAYAAAAGAVHVLEKAKLFDSVEAAIGGLHCIFATTARERGQMKRILTPAEAMPEMAARIKAGERHGIMFGPERTGLDNDEVAIADAVITFPVNPAYASLNLAQAVLLCGYEWMRAAHGDSVPFAIEERSPAAPREMIVSFFDYLEGELEKAGFFRPVGKMPVMRRNLRNMFHRMTLTEQDVRTWRGMIVRLVEGPRREAQDRKTAVPVAPRPEETDGQDSPEADSGWATLSSDLRSAATPQRAAITPAAIIKPAPKR